MSENDPIIIEIQKGQEYHILVDDLQNIYDKNRFFYTVYQKSANLVTEICTQSFEKIKNNDNDFSNNIIMYCAERGVGKSSAMRSFANLLANFEKEKRKSEEILLTFFSREILNCRFSVLNLIDPTTISEKDLFMRVILSKMFVTLRQKWDKEIDSNICINEQFHNSIVTKFMECYRLLDVIYQKGGEFDCNDDLEDLTDLGDSGRLTEKFTDLVKYYLTEMLGENSRNNFLVIQIDDADLNAKMAFDIIEDIRKYCIIPNVIILMAVNMKQMQDVLEQHFINDFKTLLDISKASDEITKSLYFSNCQKTAARYIDKIMPSAHQIHLPTIDDFIRNNNSDLTVKFYENNTDPYDHNNRKDYLEFYDNDGCILTDYQEILIRLIYNKTGIPIIKANNYLHNLLPQTMRGLAHFLAYLCPLPDINQNLSIIDIERQINKNFNKGYIRINYDYDEIDNNSINEAESELKKRINNLDSFEQYFLKNWCAIRLNKSHQYAIEDIANTVNEQKISATVKWIDRLYENSIDTKVDNNNFSPNLSALSFAYLQEKLCKISAQAHNTSNSAEVYRFTYAIRFYFTLFFNRMLLLCIKKDNNFYEILKITNFEVWAPHFPNLPHDFDHSLPERFEINYKILNKLISANNNKSEDYNNIKRNGFINIYNIVYPLDLPNPNIHNHITLKNKLDENQTVKLFCDFGASLLYYACKGSSDFYYSTSDNADDALRNYLFTFLLNWDIQRYAEKLSDNEMEYPNPLNVDSLRINYLHKMFDRLKKINYLPIEWNNENIASNFGEGMSTLQFANKEIAFNLVENLICFLKEQTKNVSLTQLETDKTRQYNQIFRLTMSAIFNMVQAANQLRVLSSISPTTKELLDIWESLYSKITNFSEIIKKPARKSITEKTKNELNEFICQISSPFEEWKNFITNQQNLEKIKEEITQAFTFNE